MKNSLWKFGAFCNSIGMNLHTFWTSWSSSGSGRGGRSTSQPRYASLADIGLSMDLDTRELGPGKLVVSHEIAWQTVVALEHRSQILNRGHVVVSLNMEQFVLDLVSRLSKRCNPVKHEEELDLSRP